MKVSNVEKLEKSQVMLTIEADAAEFESAIQTAYKKAKGKIMIPGFRKGKAPRTLIERMYGAEIFYEDAINEIYPELLEKAVEEQKLDTVGYPKVELVDANKDGFSFKATLAVRPEVKLGQYKGLTAPKEVLPVTEKDVENEMRPLIQRATRLVDVDRAAEKGDTVTIDFEGFLNGKPFDGGKGENHDLELGSGSFIPGFEDQLIGTVADQDVEVKVTFPEDYNAKDLAGKEAVFKVKVHGVKTKEVPEIDDEFAKDVSEFETLDQLKEDLKKKVADRREAAARRAFEEALLDQVTGGMECDIPDAMVDMRTDQMVENYAQQITSQGMSFDQYLSMTGMTVDVLRTQAHEGALRQVKTDLALKAVAEAEGLSVSDQEIEEEIKKLAEQYGMEVDQVKGVVSNDQLKSDLLNRKAANVIYDSAKVGEAPKKAEE